MSTKSEVMTALNAAARSLADLGQAALAQEANTEELMGQGKSVSKTLGELVAAIGTLNDRLGHYLDNADTQGRRINELERKVRELSADAE
jgi:DNA repair ATPase RecN